MRRKNYQILAIAAIALMLVSAVQADPITAVTVTNGGQPTLAGPLAVGTKLWNNRDHTFTQVPDSVLGADYVQTKMDDKNSATYTLSLDLAVTSDVYLFIDYRVGDTSVLTPNDPPILTSKMLWVAELGYVDTGENVVITDTQCPNYRIYKATFPAGTAVLVGKEQNDGGTRGMYTVAAVASKANNASNPRPANKATMVPIDAVLQWDAPANPEIDPAAVKYYVFMDPNETKVNNSDENSNLCWFYSDEMLNTLTVDPSPSEPLPYLQKYYWKVNTKLTLPGQTEPNVFEGATWSFTVAPENSTPIADAGDSIVTWLEKAQSNTVQLAGSVIDLEGDATTSWTAYRLAFGSEVPATEVIFADQSPTTTVTISAVGEYTLKLTATDVANQTTSSAMKITVYDTACNAAKNNPAGYTKDPYDYDDDCVVDIDDLKSIAEDWLVSTAATQDAYFTETVGDPKQGLVAEYWMNVPGGSDPNLLLNDLRYPDSPTSKGFVAGGTEFRFTGLNKDNYGMRTRGYLIAPATGDYTFYISSDDNSRLFLSTDTDPANAVMIAYTGYTAQDNWTANTTQASALQSLVEGQYYYVEVIFMENAGSDYYSVGWKKPGDTAISVVPASTLRWYLPVTE